MVDLHTDTLEAIASFAVRRNVQPLPAPLGAFLNLKAAWRTAVDGFESSLTLRSVMVFHEAALTRMNDPMPESVGLRYPPAPRIGIICHGEAASLPDCLLPVRVCSRAGGVTTEGDNGSEDNR
jgi:hypothetical protein